jgi:cytochrome P450
VTPEYPFRVSDPYVLPEEFTRLRVDAPVCPARVATDDEVWLVTAYEEARAALSDRRLSRNIFRPEAARLIPGVPTRQPSSPFVEPPGHTRWRKIVGRVFTPRHVEGMRGRVQEVVDELFADMTARPQPVDLMAHFAYPLSNTVVCELVGISLDEHEPFRRLAETALTIGEASMEEMTAAFVSMSRFAEDLVAAKRKRPGDDLLSKLISVEGAEEGKLTAAELAATIIALFIGGYESTVTQIGKGLIALLRNPDQLAAVRSDPALMRSAVEETLRYAALDSGFGSPRFATEDVPLGGVVVPKNATVLVIRQAANRDPSVFKDPERFDATREPNPHVAFGYGPHVCMGSFLARIVLEIGIGTVITGLPGMRLAVPFEEIAWDYRITASGPKTLPITW